MSGNKEEITREDLEQIYFSNLRIGGKTIAELRSGRIDVLEHLKNMDDPETNTWKLCSKYLAPVMLNPWYFSVVLPKRLKKGSQVMAMILPHAEVRNILGCDKKPEYKNGYELPVLLVNETLSVDTFLHLSSTLSAITKLQNFSCFGDRAVRMAWEYLLYVFLMYEELVSGKFGYPSFLRMGELENCGLSEGKISALRTMTDEEKTELVLALNQPVSKVEKLLKNWYEFGQAYASDTPEYPAGEMGIWLPTVFPPFFISMREFEEIFQSEVIDQRELTVAIPWKSARLIDELRGLAVEDISTAHSVLINLLNDKKLSPVVDTAWNVFKRLGNFWLVCFEGKVVPIKDLDGMGYLRCLLANPHKHFHVYTLIDLTGGREFSDASAFLSRLSSAELKDLGLSISDLDRPQSLIDRKTRQAVEKMIVQIEEKLESGTKLDPSEVPDLKETKEHLEYYVRASEGYDGRDGNFSSSVQKARINVKNRITGALEEIERFHKPLWQHLHSHIETGKYCAYKPDEPVKWDC